MGMNKNFAEVLESYMIAEEATNLKAAFAVLGISVIASGIKAYSDYRKKKEENKRRDVELRKAAEEAKRKHEEWKKTSEYKEIVSYINKKYGVDFDNCTDDQRDKLIDKIRNTQLNDIKKIVISFNKNKKLLNKIADQYVREYCNGDITSYDKNIIDQITDGPFTYKISEEGKDFINLTVCDMDQETMMVCYDYIYTAIKEAFDIKYYNEYKLKIAYRAEDYDSYYFVNLMI